MAFSLGFLDLGLLLAFTAFVLLVMSELLSPQYGKTNVHIDNKKLENAALAVSILFLTMVMIRIVTIIFAFRLVE